MEHQINCHWNSETKIKLFFIAEAASRAGLGSA
jgi:hypothetical protein